MCWDESECVCAFDSAFQALGAPTEFIGGGYAPGFAGKRVSDELAVGHRFVCDWMEYGVGVRLVVVEVSMMELVQFGHGSSEHGMRVWDGLWSRRWRLRGWCFHGHPRRFLGGLFRFSEKQLGKFGDGL